VEAAGKFKVLQVCRKSLAKKRPYYTWNDFEFLVTGADGKEIKKGVRTDGVVTLKGSAAPMTVAVRDFWQNYEKAIELDGKTLKVWLWPTEGQWPRAYEDLRSRELYDAKLQAAPKDGLYLLQGGVHKGHEILLDFSGGDPGAARAEVAAPLYALAGAAYYATTEAAPGLFAPPDVKTGRKTCDNRLESRLRMAQSIVDPENPAGIPQARRINNDDSFLGYFGDTIYWYGWMDFGDISVPAHGPVSLQYDWLWIMLTEGLRTGDMRFVRMAEEMARHRIDVDQVWSHGLQRGSQNYPSFHTGRLTYGPGVGSNHLAGPAFYYMLTGDPKALECCRRNAEALKAAWENIIKTRPSYGPQGDMAANGWGIQSFCSLYDLTADRKWLEEAMKLFNANVTERWKACGPFLHDPLNQFRSQSYVKEDQGYCLAIQPLCELHVRTGDENVMKLLKEGCEKPFPESFYSAPMFLADQYAYVGLKTGNAELLKKAATSFAAAFPASKCPPVFLPKNSVWAETSAMTLRAGHLLQYACWKMPPAPAAPAPAK